MVKCRKVRCFYLPAISLIKKMWSFNLRDQFLRDSLDSYRDEFLIPNHSKNRSQKNSAPLKDVIKAASAAANKSSGVSATSSWPEEFFPWRSEEAARPTNFSGISPTWQWKCHEWLNLFFSWSNHGTMIHDVFLGDQKFCVSVWLDFWHLEVGNTLRLQWWWSWVNLRVLVHEWLITVKNPIIRWFHWHKKSYYPRTQEIHENGGSKRFGGDVLTFFLCFQICEVDLFERSPNNSCT